MNRIHDHQIDDGWGHTTSIVVLGDYDMVDGSVAGNLDPEGLAAALADMARDLLSQPSLQATLDRIVVHSVALVDGCEAAGIMVIRNREVHTLAATDDVVHVSDRMQGEAGEGPCFDAIRSAEEVFRITDTETDAHRWPRYAPHAERLKIGSMLGFKLFTEEETLGSLNLYSPEPGAFTAKSEQTGWLLASHSAVAFANARSDAHLHAAISSRQLIGEAIGILMERHRLSEDEAFATLTQASQDHNIKIRQLARRIVETGGIGTDL